MSCSVLISPTPFEDTAGSRCTPAVLRLIEHYELDYAVTSEPLDRPPRDGEELSARRWNSYYCSACHSDFTSRLLALLHTGELSAEELAA